MIRRRLTIAQAAIAVPATLVPWVALVGWIGPQIPDRFLDKAKPVGSLRAYERVLRIRTWKDRLPEGGAVLGGASKRSLGDGSRGERMQRFARESRRAELVHVAALLPVPLLVAISPCVVALPTLIGAAFSNLPCLAVTRYNRGRIERTLAAARPSTSS